MEDYDIVKDIETTLEKLLNNADTLKGMSISNFSALEFESMQKIQESLIAHLLFLDNLLQDKKNNTYANLRFKIKEKLSLFSTINQTTIKTLVGNGAVIKFGRKAATKQMRLKIIPPSKVKAKVKFSTKARAESL